MKVLEWTGPEKLQISNMPKPELEPNWVLLKIESVGICGSELSGYLGHNSLRKPPLIMGHEFTGEIVEVGNSNAESRIGELVTVNPLISCGKCQACLNGSQQLCNERKIIGIHMPGAFAEYVRVPEGQCQKVTNKLWGSMTEPLACSLRAINQANIQVGDVGVVIGAGIIGLMAIKLMKQKGASRIIALDTNITRLKSATSWGATHTLNPMEVDVLQEIRKLSPNGVDRVIDAVGYSKTRKQALDSLRRGGRAVFIGLHEDETLLAGNEIVRNEIEIAGTFCYSADEFIRAALLIEEGFLDNNGDAWYDVRSLKDGNQAFQEQINGKAHFSKIVLVP